MKNHFALLVLSVINFYLLAKKIYYTEDFTELFTAEGATYYSTYEDNERGTTRTTYFIDGTIRNYDQFSNFKTYFKWDSKVGLKGRIWFFNISKGKLKEFNHIL
jgi:hypothetical protein